jgi:CTP synthase
VISERHRHRYEVNPVYHPAFIKDGGMVFSGMDQSNTLVETVELKNHPFFIASQFHPEFASRPLSARPYSKDSFRRVYKVNKGRSSLQNSFLLRFQLNYNKKHEYIIDCRSSIW